MFRNLDIIRAQARAEVMNPENNTPDTMKTKLAKMIYVENVVQSKLLEITINTLEETNVLLARLIDAQNKQK
jgi:hypothetical protein